MEKNIPNKATQDPKSQNILFDQKVLAGIAAVIASIAGLIGALKKDSPPEKPKTTIANQVTSPSSSPTSTISQKTEGDNSPVINAGRDVTFSSETKKSQPTPLANNASSPTPNDSASHQVAR